MGTMVIAVAIGVSLGAGLVIGILGIIALAVRREDRHYSLTGQAPGSTARGVRRLTGIAMRDVTPTRVRLHPAGRVSR